MEDLLVKYISGSATQQEKQDVMDWVNADQKNKKEFEAFQNAYFVSLWTDDLPLQFEQENYDDEINMVSIHKNPVWKNILRIAAVLLVGVSLFINIKHYWTNDNPDEVGAMQSVRVPSGQRVELSLADGTKVWVNANSKLEYPATFSKSQRIVYLDGEGRFDVSHDEDSPFIVKTKDYDVKVLGTEFNLKAYSKKQKFEAALMVGKVEVYYKNDNQKVTLSPNEMAIGVNGKLTVSEIISTDPYRWTEGLLTFENESIEDILHKMEDYFDVKILIKNKNLKGKKYTGKFWIDDGVEEMLNVLRKTNDFKYSRNFDTKEYIIY